MAEAWKAVVDGVQDARARARMRQLSFTGLCTIMSISTRLYEFGELVSELLRCVKAITSTCLNEFSK